MGERGSGGVGGAIARKLKAFCVKWGGFNFVSQKLHNTKILGVGDVFVCRFVFLYNIQRGVCYINRLPNKYA